MYFGVVADVNTLMVIKYICGVPVFNKLTAKLDAIERKANKMFEEELDLVKLEEIRRRRRKFFAIETPRTTPKTQEETFHAKVSSERYLSL